MNPVPYPTRLEQAAALDISAKVAYDSGNIPFARELEDHAHKIRMEEAQNGNGTHDLCTNLFAVVMILGAVILWRNTQENDDE